MKKVTIKVRVPTDRSFIGELVVNVEGEKTTFPVSAMISPEINGTEPPVGNYTWVKTATVTGDDNIEAYGECVVFFQNVSNEIMLAIHGGATDLHDQLLATEGGLRLHNMDLSELCQLINGSKPSLIIEEYNLSFFKKITGSKVSERIVPPRYYSGYSNSTPTTYYNNNDSNRSDDLSDILFLMWLFSDNTQPNVQNQDSGIISGGGGDFGGGGATGTFPETVMNNKENDVVTQTDTVDASLPPLIIDPFGNNQIDTVTKQDDSDRGTVQTEILPGRNDTIEDTPPQNTSTENSPELSDTEKSGQGDTSTNDVTDSSGTAY